MSEIKITDLVPQETIDRIRELDAEMQKLVERYANTARELAKGLEIKVSVIGDIDKIEKIYVEKTREAAETARQMNAVMDEQRKVVTDTTSAIARELMERERATKVEREAYTNTEKFKAMLEKVNGSYEERIRRSVQLDEELKAAKAREAALNAEYKKGLIDKERYIEIMTELRTETRALKQEQADLNLHLKNEEREANTVEGSYRNLSQRLELMRKAYQSLTEEEINSPAGKEMAEAMQELNAHLIDLDANMGNHQRNVGNYAIASRGLKKEYNELVITLAALQSQFGKLSEEEKASEEGQKLAQSIDEVSASARETRAAMDEQNAALEEARRSLGDTSEKTSSVKRDLKELVLEIANLTIQYQNLTAEEQASAEGQELAEHIRELTEQAGVLKDAIADTNQAITNAASDTRGFDQVGGAIQLAIDGFGLATGAAEMLGISSEDLASIQTKLQAAIAASNAMQSIQNTLQAQSAVMQGVNLVQTKLRTTAENLHTAAQGKGTIATAAMTAAQWAFNAAANANPIGLLVAAIVAAIGVIYGLVKAFQYFFGTSDEAIEAYNAQREALDELCEANDRLIETMKARGATEAELLVQTLQNKQAEKEAAEALFARASELYDEDEDEYKDALEAKNKAEEDFINSKEDGLNYLEKIQAEVYAYEREKAIGTLAYKLEIIEAERKKQLELATLLYLMGEKTQQQYKDIVASVNKLAEIKIGKVKAEQTPRTPRRSSFGGGGGSARNAADDLKKAVQAGEDALVKVIEDGVERQRQAEMLGYSRRLKELNAALAKTKSTQVTMIKAIQDQIKGLTAEHYRKLAAIAITGAERINKAQSDLIAFHLSAVETDTKEGREHLLKLTLEAIEKEHQAELIALQKAQNENIYKEEEAEQIRADLAVKYDKKREETIEEHAAKMADIIEKNYAKTNESAETQFILEMAHLQEDHNERLKAAKGNNEKIEEENERFQKKCDKVNKEHAIQRAKDVIEMYEKMLQTASLPDDLIEDLKDKLARARAELKKLEAEMGQPDTQEPPLIDPKFIAAFDKWSSKALEVFGVVNDAMQSYYDNQIAKIEELQEANEAAGAAEEERISELVEKKVISEEEGEARKRAAAAETAKKNEELEKKKQKLKIKQAKWDKANSISQATISTALAVMNALNTKPFMLGLALAAIASAMGAVQIATIASTPIPAYAKGTDSHKGGPAIVGDGGRQELILFNGNAWLTPDRPTIMDIPAGASVIPDAAALAAGLPGPIDVPVAKEVTAIKPYDDSAIRRGLAELTSLVKMQIKQQHADAYQARYELFKSKI